MATPTEHHCGFTPPSSKTSLSTISETTGIIDSTTSGSMGTPYTSRSSLDHSSMSSSTPGTIGTASYPTTSGTSFNSTTSLSANSLTSNTNSTQMTNISDTQSTKTSGSQLSKASNTQLMEMINNSQLSKAQDEESAIGLRIVSMTRPHRSSRGKRLLVMRHAERMDLVFSNWINEAYKGGDYKPYDLNQPLTLPKRPPADYSQDAPLTEMGKMTAQMVGRGLHVNHILPVFIVSSPALSCVQTAAELLKMLKSDQSHRICVEPGLFEFTDCYETPAFLSPQRLFELNYPIDISYKPQMSYDELHRLRETAMEFKQRMHKVIRSLVEQSKGTTLVVGHATTVDLTTRSLLGIDQQETATRQKLDECASRYPFCAMVSVEQAIDESWRVLHNAVPPMTYMDCTSRIDHRYFFRNQLV